MKNILILISIVTASLSIQAQTIVSTSPEKKNALIEDFTGVNCGFCPYGHKEIAQFMAAHPGDGFGITIHQGYYAIPGAGQPNLQTAVGDAWGEYFNANSWPAGMVNRHDWGSGYLYQLNEWQGYGNQILAQDSYVNVACEATIDVQTRELTVHVETYYTGNSPQSTNKLNVAMLQSNIKSTQWGGWFNPDALTPDGQYLHKHVLRDMLTDMWGVDLSPTTTGTFIDNTFTYTIPDDYIDVPVRLGDVEILSFINESEVEMPTVNGTIPVLMNIQYANDAAVESIELPESGCSYITSKTVVQNTGSTDITSITFQISINGGTPESYSWTGDALKPYTAMDVYVPAVFFDNGEDQNEYVITVTAVNGTTDENPANNTSSGTFEGADEYALPVGLHLETDDNAWGTTWELRDGQNNVIQSGDSYGNNSTYNISLSADAGCYSFIMKDSDGFFFGSYSLTDGDNNVIVSVNGAFGNIKTTAFALPFYTPTAGIGSSTSILCEGGTVQFSDASTGGATSWNWTFEGGDPPTSTEKNPEVVYYNPGTYDVSLEVSNSFGSDEITLEDYISVYSLSYGNRALEFNGIDNYVEATDESAFDIQDEITLECWFKPGSLSGMQGLMSKNYGNNAHPYQVRLVDNEIVFGFYSNTIGWQSIQTYGANLTVGQWSHIAAVYNMSTMKIYVNGVQKATANKNFQIPLNNQPFEIARTNDINYKYFNGRIDEVRVWNRALLAGEVSENLCTNYTSTTDTTLIAYYKFNECGGTLVSDVIGGHDGLLKNMIGFEWYDSDACDSYSITFNVTEENGGAFIEGAAINLNGSTKFTNAQGQVVFEGYEPGLYDYIVSKNAYWDVSGNFELTDEDVTIDITMTDQPVYYVNFVVFEDPSGTPIEDAVVDLDGTINMTNSDGEVTFGNIEAGTYTWTVSKEGFVTQAGTCEVVDDNITVEVAVLIVSVEEQLKNEVKVYPNPSNGKLYVSISDKDAGIIDISVTDLTGRVIYNNFCEGQGKTSIDLPEKNPGMYILNLRYNNKSVNRIIIIK